MPQYRNFEGGGGDQKSIQKSETQWNGEVQHVPLESDNSYSIQDSQIKCPMLRLTAEYLHLL